MLALRMMMCAGGGGVVASGGRLYHCDFGTDKNYELDPDTLAVINTVSSPSSNPFGIGGTK